MSQQNDSSSTAVERTLLILEAAAQREGGMSNAEFSRKLKIFLSRPKTHGAGSSYG